MEMGGEQVGVRVGEVIPGLPDDVAMECLARVPSRWHRPMRHVCRRVAGIPSARLVVAASGYPTHAQGAFKKSDADAWSEAGDMVPEPDTAGRTALTLVGGKVWAIGPGKGGVREWDGAWRDVADGPPGMKACVEAVGIGDGDAVFVFGKVADYAEESGKYAAWVMDAGAARWGRVQGFGGFVFSAAAVRV